MTEDEVKVCITVGRDDGAITEEERKMLSRVFTLNDKTVGQIMVPKEKMITISSDTTVEEAMRVVLKTGHTRFPITKERSEIIGFIHAKDLFKLPAKKGDQSLKNIIRPARFIPAEKTIDAQLRSFQVLRLHQAIVLDDNGSAAGLITLEDILEELVGSIEDEHD
jgi:magnesium and cobalt transporter